MSARFTFDLILQLIGLINRDFLTYLSPFGYTENFNWYDTVQLWPQNWPALLVYETDNTFNPMSEHTFQQSIHILCRMELSETDHNVVAQKSRAYLGALNLLIGNYDWQNRTADFHSPVPLPPSLYQLGTATTGLPATSNITRIFVERFTFDEFGQRESNYILRSTAHVLVNMEEGQ